MPGLDDLEAETLAEMTASGSPLDQLEAEAQVELRAQAPVQTDARMWPTMPQKTLDQSLAEAEGEGGLLNYVEAFARHAEVPGTGITGTDVMTGAEQGRNDLVMLASRLAGDSQGARHIERQSEVAGGEADAISDGVLGKAARGATRSLVPMALTAGGGAIAPILTAAGISGASAVSEAEDAGLEGADKTGYIARAASIEALPALIFQRLGLGGVEKAMGEAFRQPAQAGVRQALAQAGRQTFLGELPEEYITAAAEIANQKLSGVDVSALTAEQIAETFRDVTLQTLMMGGAANAPNVVSGALNDRAAAKSQDLELARMALGGLDPQQATNGQLPAPTEQDAPLAITPEVVQTALQNPDILRLFGIRGTADETALNQQRETQLRERAQSEQARMDQEAARAREVRAISDDAASVAADRAAGEESLRRSDDEALRQMELAELIDNALGTKPRAAPAEPQVAVGREPDAPVVNDERQRFDAGRAAADSVEAEYQAELQAINARRTAAKGEKIGKDQAVALRREALDRRNQRMAEAIERATNPAPSPSVESVPASSASEAAPAFEQVEDVSPVAEKSSTPAPVGPSQQDQDAAIAELERIAGETAARSGKVEDFPALLSQLGPLGYRVDRSQGLPEGAEKKRAALEAAAKARGVDLSTIVRQAQERALAKQPKPKAEPVAKADQPAGEWLRFPDDSGTLGIPREEMPQIKTEHRGALSNYLRARGIEWTRDEFVDPKTLKPTQAEFSRKKMLKAKQFSGDQRAILVSSDGHILDGHHQWLAAKQAGKSIPVIRLDAPIERLMEEVRSFPSAEASTESKAATPESSPGAPVDDGVPFARDDVPEDDGKQGGSLMLPGQEFTSEDLIRQQRKAEGDRRPVSGQKGWQKLQEESTRTEQERFSQNRRLSREDAEKPTDRIEKPKATEADARQAHDDQAAVRSQMAGRIQPAPLTTDGPVKKLADIVNGLADWLGMQKYVSRKLGRGFAGYYDPASGAQVLKRGTDLSTFAHETGHWLDDRFGLIADGAGGTTDVYDHELMKRFAPYGSKPDKNHPDPESYKRAEGVAEWIRAWAMNPAAAEAAAPLFTARFRAAVPEPVRNRMREFGDDIRRFHHAPALEAGAANIVDLNDTGPTLVERLAQWWSARGQRDKVGQPLRFGLADAARVRLTDRLWPLAKAIGWAGRETGREQKAQQAENLVRLMAGINDKVGAVARIGMIKAEWLKDGQIQRADGVEGGIEHLAGWVDATSADTINRDLRDLDAYMVAQSVAEQAQTIDKQRVEMISQAADRIGQWYTDAREALDDAAKVGLAKADKMGQKIAGKVVTAAEKTDDRNRSQAERTDKELGRIQDEVGDGRTGAERRADRKLSATRERLAGRTDALSKAINQIAEAADKGSNVLVQDTQRKIDAAEKALERRYQVKMSQLGRVAIRMEQRDAARKARLSGQGGGTRADDAQAERILAAAAEDPVRLARLDEGAKRYRAWADGVLRYLVDKGRMSQESYQQIKANNEFYVAMQRNVEDLTEGNPRPAGGGKIGTAKEVVKARKGSTRTIENPLTSLLESTAKAIEEADRNEAVRATVDLLREARRMHDSSKEATDVGSVAVRMENPGPGTVKVFRNGEVEHWKFAPEIQESIKGLSEQYRVPWIMSILPTLVRTGIVKSPPFAIRNRIRDIGARLIIGQNQPGTAAGWMKRLVEQVPVIGRAATNNRITDEKKAIVELAGGAFAGHYLRGRQDWQKETAKRVKELRQDKNTIVTGLKNAGSAYNRMIESSEFAGRADEFWNNYEKLRADGVDEMSAALMASRAARDLVDFGVSGTWVGTLNQVTPFLNAAVQGIRATTRAMTRNPAGFAVRWAMFSVVPSLLAYGWAASGDEDDLEEYVELPAWRRDLFWNFKMGGIWISIPKPFELGVTGSAVERGVEAAHRVAKGEDVAEATNRAFDGYAGSLAKSVIPVEADSMVLSFGPLIETFLANKSFYTGKDIIPRWEIDKPVAERTGAQFASRLGKAGSFLSAGTIDPRQIDHLTRGIFGQLGGLAADASDVGREDKSGWASRMVAKGTGLGGGVSPDQQVSVSRFMEEEGAAGRGDAKAAKAINDMRRAYWKAASTTEREAIAEAMRDYATGKDPVMAFDRAVTESNRLLTAWRNLPTESRVPFAKENQQAIVAANRINAANRVVLAAKKQGKTRDEIVAIIKRAAPGIELANLVALTKDAKAGAK